MGLRDNLGGVVGGGIDSAARARRTAHRFGGCHRRCSAVRRRWRKVLFNEFVLPFEIASVLLLVAIIGAVVLAKREHEGVIVGLQHYLILSAVIFSIGVIGVLIRRNLIVILMSIELMLNAVNLTFIAFSRYLGSTDGQVIVFFVMAVAAAEAVIGLAIIISVFRHRQTSRPAGDAATQMVEAPGKSDRQRFVALASADSAARPACSICSSAAGSESNWRGALASAAVGASFAAGVPLILANGVDGDLARYRLIPGSSPVRFHVNLSFQVDALTAAMLLIVTGIGFLIHLYSLGYMGHDDDMVRFFIYLESVYLLHAALGDGRQSYCCSSSVGRASVFVPTC